MACFPNFISSARMRSLFTAPCSGNQDSPNLGDREFVTAYEAEFKRAPAVQSANSYAGCQIFAEAVRRAGTTDSDKLRETLLSLRTKTILGDFAVDHRGFQIGEKAVTIQWQDGKQVSFGPTSSPPICVFRRRSGLNVRCIL
jgi:ABC-type branched-subunit amino acid transport system substrate-binding protein